MARFDVYANPEGAGYLLDVQSNILDDFNTRVVVPLISAAHAPVPARRLNPTFQIGAETCVMVTQYIAAVPSSLLRLPVTNLVRADAEISSALDMLLVGF